MDPSIKNDTSSGDMDEKVDPWFDSFENVHKKYIIILSLSLNYLLIEESFLSQFNHPQVSLIEKIKQDII